MPRHGNLECTLVLDFLRRKYQELLKLPLAFSSFDNMYHYR